MPIAEPGIPESFKVLVKELQALGLDIKILTEGNKEISLSELSQAEQDQVTIASDTENELKEILDFDDMLGEKQAEEETKDELQEVFEESTKNDSLDSIDIFDDFGDFDE